MFKAFKKKLPVGFKKLIANNQYYRLRQLRKNYNLDMKQFIKHSFVYGNEKEQRHYEADLIFFYHKIEKGLALPSPRIGFGEKSVEHLISILEYYIKKYGWDKTSLTSLKTLIDYRDYNLKNNLKQESLNKRIGNLRESVEYDRPVLVGGTQEVSREDINRHSNIDFKAFAYSRYSIRNFDEGEVSFDAIEEAVHIAQKTPSVCNRQSSKVYIYNDKEIKREILSHQNGNAGFGEMADKILIVTIELKDFRGVGERNQSYIDGGMYSMSLIYALHSLGIGSCPLNLALTKKKENKLKKAAKIGDSEVLLMMIAIGNIPEKLKVACSPRREAREVMKIY